MLWILAETERDRALMQGYWSITLIGLIGLGAVLLLILIFMGRRWSRRQLQAIEKAKAQRREAKSTQRVDAWQTSAHRYIDHDKLPDEKADEPEPPDEPDDDDEHSARSDRRGPDEPDEEKDPYGLFEESPYRDPDDEDDDDPEEDWDDDPWDEDDDRPH